MSQVLDHIFGENEGEDTKQHSDSDRQVSKEEDNVDYHPEDTDTSDQRWRSLVLKLLLLKDSSPKMVRSFGAQYLIMYMAAAAYVIKMTPGITRFALTKVSDIKRCFELFMPLSLKRIIITMMNLEGKKSPWRHVERY